LADRSVGQAEKVYRRLLVPSIGKDRTIALFFSLPFLSVSLSLRVSAARSLELGDPEKRVVVGDAGRQKGEGPEGERRSK